MDSIILMVFNKRSVALLRAYRYRPVSYCGSIILVKRILYEVALLRGALIMAIP